MIEKLVDEAIDTTFMSPIQKEPSEGVKYMFSIIVN